MRIGRRCRLVHDGAIGKVTRSAFVAGGRYGVADWWISARPKGDPVPKSLNWDLWLGVAPERPFKEKLYHPQTWRAWQDFSTGQLGDFGCHILDPVFMALELTAPTSIEAEAPKLNDETWARKSKVQYVFPGTDRTAGETIDVTWYDGQRSQAGRRGLGIAGEVTSCRSAGSVFVGEKGSMVLPHWSMPRLFPEEKFADYNVPQLEDLNHYTSWAHACLGDGETTSHFGYSGRLTEAVLLGGIAIRFPKEQLKWDAAKGQFTHHADANARLTKEYRKGWELPAV